MVCSSCGAEAKGNFCRSCGTPIQLEQQQITPIIDNIQEIGMERQQPIVSPQQEMDKREVQEKSSTSLSMPHYFISLSIAAFAAFLLVSGTAFLLNWLVKRGELLQDLTYHLLKNVVNIAPEHAAYFTSHMTPGFWMQLMLLNGGTINGTYLAQYADGAEQVLLFNLHVPLLFSVVLGLVLIGLTLRLLRPLIKQQSDNQWHRLLWIIGFSLVYALLMMLVLVFTAPDSRFVLGNDQFTLELSLTYWKLFLSIFSMSLIASAVGIGQWKFLQYSGWNSWARSIRSFVITLCVFFLLIAGLMTVNWSTANQSQLQSTQIMTMGSVWKEYKSDPTVYAIIPNVLLQELIYSLGGTWHVTGQSSADLLGMKQPVKLHLLTGADENSVEEYGQIIEERSEGIAILEDDLRFGWYHFALIFMFLYALSRIRINQIRIYIVTVVGIIMAAALLSVYSNVKVVVGEVSTAYIGFNLGQTALAVGVCVALFLAASYGVQRLLARRRGTDV